MTQIVLASNNSGKLREIQAVLSDLNLSLLPQSQFNVVEAEETGLSFVENAILKARNCCEQTGLPALADDSGLEIEYLRGEPGIYSARYAGKDATDQDNVAKVLDVLANVPKQQRQARFYCVIAYMRHANDPTPIIAQGYWQGEILLAPQGENGFGYDPIFYVPSESVSAAQLPANVKNKISHRAMALKNLVTQFSN